MTTVRPIDPADETAWRRLFTDYGVFYHESFPDSVLDGVWAWLCTPGHAVRALVATDDAGAVIGFAHVREQYDTFTAGTNLYLEDLYVDPAARGTGAATALIEAIRAEAYSRGLGPTRWITASDNLTAQRVYDRLATRTTWVTYEMESD